MSGTGPIITLEGADDILAFDELINESNHRCAFCNEALDLLDEGARQYHYELHFREQEEEGSEIIEVSENPNSSSNLPKTSTSTNATNKPALTNKNSSFVARKKTLETFWTASHAAESAPPSNYTAGLIPILKRALVKTHAKGVTRRAILCREGVSHIHSELSDMGWGCGYRNYLMGCTALYEQDLMPQYRSLLEQHGGPSVRNLQALIEMAWSDGYDKVGAAQLKNKLVNTRKWIGTGDVYVAYTYCGIPVRLIDFPEVTDPQIVTQWVANYFLPSTSSSTSPKNVQQMLSGASPIVETGKMPLILQHQGHSRTIVGIEFNRFGAPNLLIFDHFITRRIPSNVRQAAHASLPRPNHSHSNSGSHSHKSHAKRAMNKILHPLKNVNGKRPRSNIFSDNEDDDDEVIEVDVIDVDQPNVKRMKGRVSSHNGSAKAAGSSNHKSKSSDGDELDPLKILNLFRVNLSHLKKKDQYQILEFTLDEPLTPSDKWSRRVVKSERIS